MITISTKQLRTNFQGMLDKISQNEHFILIHKSKPVAEISPVRSLQTFEQATAKDIETAAVSDLGAEELSLEARDYYLSLS